MELKEIDPDPAGDCGRTPLWWAAVGGHEGVAKMLLERNGVNPDTADIYKETPLAMAALKGMRES